PRRRRGSARCSASSAAPATTADRARGPPVPGARSAPLPAPCPPSGASPHPPPRTRTTGRYWAPPSEGLGPQALGKARPPTVGSPGLLGGLSASLHVQRVFLRGVGGALGSAGGGRWIQGRICGHRPLVGHSRLRRLLLRAAHGDAAPLRRRPVPDQ